MSRQVVKTNRAPAPIGPYNQAIRVGNMMFLSGQIALEPSSGKILAQDVAGQTRQVIENLHAVLQAGNMDLDNVVKTTIYLKRMSDFPTVNDVYNGYFADSAPARATVEVSRLPKDVDVEIDAIAIDH